jgi:hypothetical protein
MYKSQSPTKRPSLDRALEQGNKPRAVNGARSVASFSAASSKSSGGSSSLQMSASRPKRVPRPRAQGQSAQDPFFCPTNTTTTAFAPDPFDVNNNTEWWDDSAQQQTTTADATQQRSHSAASLGGGGSAKRVVKVRLLKDGTAVDQDGNPIDSLKVQEALSRHSAKKKETEQPSGRHVGRVRSLDLDQPSSGSFRAAGSSSLKSRAPQIVFNGTTNNGESDLNDAGFDSGFGDFPDPFADVQQEPTDHDTARGRARSKSRGRLAGKSKGRTLTVQSPLPETPGSPPDAHHHHKDGGSSSNDRPRTGRVRRSQSVGLGLVSRYEQQETAPKQSAATASSSSRTVLASSPATPSRSIVNRRSKSIDHRIKSRHNNDSGSGDDSGFGALPLLTCQERNRKYRSQDELLKKVTQIGITEAQLHLMRSAELYITEGKLP